MKELRERERKEKKRKERRMKKRVGGKKEKREEKIPPRCKEFSLHFFSSTQKEELKGGKNHSLEHEQKRKK